MITAITLTATCISIILRKKPVAGDASSRRPVIPFAALAAVSLATTWYYMFCYFRWSYLDWASTQPLHDSTDLRLGQWLRDTSLFKQAWASTVRTPLRTWWSLQIFGFCAIWSIILAVQAKRRGIPHAWVFMLLGQIVAISFAANLSFIAFTIYDDALPQGHDRHVIESSEGKAGKNEREPSPTSSSSLTTFWWPLILGINMACAICIPNSFGSWHFMSLLLVPHVLAFAPMLLTTFQSSPNSLELPPVSLQIWCIASFSIIAIIQAVSTGGDLRRVLDTLYEHPAVSSVGWDVICCWVSFTAWGVFSSRRRDFD